MNAAIFASLKAIDQLYPEVDELRKTLTLDQVDVDSTDFLDSLAAAYAGVQACLQAEHDRLGALSVADHTINSL